MESLSYFTSLYHLNVSCNKFTNTGLGYIGKLNSLEELDISSNQQITDEGIVYLKTLPLLLKIDIGNCDKLTGVCLIHLGVLSSLKVIGICELPISNDIIENIKIWKRNWEFVDNGDIFH